MGPNIAPNGTFIRDYHLRASFLRGSSLGQLLWGFLRRGIDRGSGATLFGSNFDCKCLDSTYVIPSTLARARASFSTQPDAALALVSSKSDNEDLAKNMVEKEGFVASKIDSPSEVLWRWGCSITDITSIFQRQPSLRNACATNLKHKLNILSGLGITSSQLVKMINCRPRFLSRSITSCLEERLECMINLFGSKELFVKAIVRNPSLLTYDLNGRVKPVLEMYEGHGLTRQDLVTMLMSRPTMIPRSSLDDAKREYIRRTGVSTGSKMFKYVVTLIAISRIETICEKLANLEKFGITEDEALGLFGRSPLILTLSVDKVQRNMTFILGTMKLEANVIIKYPFLLYLNLETVLKPRFVLAGKIQDMGLEPQIKGDTVFRALRMTEKRFVNAFVSCHAPDVADELMAYYASEKSVKRLAEASKKKLQTGFPF